jgi:hypothetical protein
MHGSVFIYIGEWHIFYFFFFIFKYIYELNICNIFLKIATEYSIRINYLFSYYNFFTYFFAN